jgi:hypothetical protein
MPKRGAAAAVAAAPATSPADPSLDLTSLASFSFEQVFSSRPPAAVVLPASSHSVPAKPRLAPPPAYPTLVFNADQPVPLAGSLRSAVVEALEHELARVKPTFGAGEHAELFAQMLRLKEGLLPVLDRVLSRGAVLDSVMEDVLMPNPQNAELERVKQVLGHMLGKFEEEIKEWGKVKDLEQQVAAKRVHVLDVPRALEEEERGDVQLLLQLDKDAQVAPVLERLGQLDKALDQVRRDLSDTERTSKVLVGGLRHQVMLEGEGPRELIRGLAGANVGGAAMAGLSGE